MTGRGIAGFRIYLLPGALALIPAPGTRGGGWMAKGAPAPIKCGGGGHGGGTGGTGKPLYPWPSTRGGTLTVFSGNGIVMSISATVLLWFQSFSTQTSSYPFRYHPIAPTLSDSHPIFSFHSYITLSLYFILDLSASDNLSRGMLHR